MTGWNGEVRDGVAYLTFDRPPLNILDIATMEPINAFLTKLRDEASLVAVVLRGSGRGFSAGVDVGEHLPATIDRMLGAFHGLFRRLWALEVPLLVGVHGMALGGGMELVLACDVVICTPDAKLGQPEIQLGVFPPLAMVLLPTRTNSAAAADLIVSGRIFSTEEGLRLGLISRIVAAEELDGAIEEALAHYRKLSPAVIKLTTRTLRDQTHPDLLARLEGVERIYRNQLLLLADSQEGLAAFMEKRTPVWRNK